MKPLQLLLLEDKEEEGKETVSFLNDHNYKTTLAKNLNEAEEELKKTSFDAIILDIMINGKPDGISLAKYVKEQKIDIPFLFLTSMQTKAIFDKAKSTKPLTYLLKPYNKLELLFALELAFESYYEQSNTLVLDKKNAVLSPQFLFVKKNKCIVKVNVSSIKYIKVEEKYCSLICDTGNYLIKLSLIKIKEILSNPDFIQVHRNYLANVNYIKEIYPQDNLIIIEEKEQIPFSERYKSSFSRNNIIF